MSALLDFDAMDAHELRMRCEHADRNALDVADRLLDALDEEPDNLILIYALRVSLVDFRRVGKALRRQLTLREAEA